MASYGLPGMSINVTGPSLPAPPPPPAPPQMVQGRVGNTSVTLQRTQIARPSNPFARPSKPVLPMPTISPAIVTARIPALPVTAIPVPRLPDRITLPPVVTPPEVAAKVLEAVAKVPLTVKGGQIMPEVGPETSGDKTAAQIEAASGDVSVPAVPAGKEVTGDVSVAAMSAAGAESGGIPTWAMALGAVALAGGAYWFFIRK